MLIFLLRFILIKLILLVNTDGTACVCQKCSIGLIIIIFINIKYINLKVVLIIIRIKFLFLILN